MPESREPQYDIAELAELSGVSRRAVRYYIQRGLLQPPAGVGRGKHYRSVHLDRLLEIRRLQEAGVSLKDIQSRSDRAVADEAASTHQPGDATATGRPETEAQPPETNRADLSALSPRTTNWTRVVVADGIELHFETERIHAELETVAELIATVRRLLVRPS